MTMSGNTQYQNKFGGLGRGGVFSVRLGAGSVAVRASHRKGCARAKARTGRDLPLCPRPSAPAFSRCTPFAGLVLPEPANARDDAFAPVSSRAPLDRDLDQAHCHGAARMCAGQQLLGASLIFLGSDQVAQGSFHFRQSITHNARTPFQGRRPDGWVMRDTRNGVAFYRNCEMNRIA